MNLHKPPVQTSPGPLDNQKGFSLLEVMVAGALLAVAIQNAIGGLAQGSVSIAHQRLMNIGMHVDQQVLEDLMLVTNTDPSLSPGIHTAYFDSNGSPSSGPSPMAPYLATWTITPDSPFPTIMSIQVQVTWSENNSTRNVTYQSFRN